MSLLRLEGVFRYFGATHVFGPLDLQVNPKEHIGLIGPNGAGKTTLLEILAGAEPDEGRVVRPKDVRVGYLRQEAPADPGIGVLEYALAAFRHLADAEARLRDLEARMASPEVQADPAALERVMEAYAQESAAFERRGGYAREAHARSALFGLGFGESDLQRPLVSLSGGERARAGLARLLLEDADVLLLDEPTNHLDLASTEWLQGFLARDERALVIVSHDRYLLDAVATTIWELEAKSVAVYPGNYTTSRRLAAERRERMQKLYEKDLEERERLEAFVRRWRAGTRATQAKSRARRLERMGEAVRPPAQGPRAHFSVDAGPRSEKRVCTCENLSVGYPGKPVLHGINLEIHRGQRIGIAGPNGAGKSTLLRTLAGDLAPLSGLVDVGRGVTRAYFAQHRIDLDPGRTVLDEALEGKSQKLGEARSFLARFLFRGDDVFKPVGVLSGGEKSRLALAKLLLHGGNFMLLDEPTNHLDIEMRESLEEAFEAYEGTLLFVTHDRALLAALADVIWWIDSGELHVVEDGYEAFEAWMAARKEASGEKRATDGGPAAADRSIPPGERGAPARGRSDALAREEQRRLRQAQKRLAELEGEIERLARRKDEMEKVLSDPAAYRGEKDLAEFGREYQEIGERLSALEDDWTRLAEEVERVRQGMPDALTNTGANYGLPPAGLGKS